MSGHSKWSTIKRAKAARDNERGKEFSKLSRAISIAVKTGGGGSIESNYKLRIAVEEAKSANMPKDTISRAITKASESSLAIEEVIYEGFGPNGIQVLIDAATDNRNRTSQEIKNIFEKSGGTLGGPGSVSFNFELVGLIHVVKTSDVESQILSLIDFGALDVEELDSEIVATVQSHELFKIKKVIEDNGINVTSSELIYKAKSHVEISDPKIASRIAQLIENLEDNEDVQNVYVNADLVGDALKSLDLINE